MKVVPPQIELASKPDQQKPKYSLTITGTLNTLGLVNKKPTLLLDPGSDCPFPAPVPTWVGAWYRALCAQRQ